jgi:hypothetical protein
VVIIRFNIFLNSKNPSHDAEGFSI